MIALVYALLELDAVYCYIQGYDPAYSKLALELSFSDRHRRCCALRASRIDFLRGTESYKLSWGAQEVPTFRAQL